MASEVGMIESIPVRLWGGNPQISLENAAAAQLFASRERLQP